MPQRSTTLIEDLPSLLAGETLTRTSRFPAATFPLPRNANGDLCKCSNVRTISVLADASGASTSTTMTVTFDPGGSASGGFAPVTGDDLSDFGIASRGGTFMSALMAASSAPPAPAFVVTLAHPHAGDLVTPSVTATETVTPTVTPSVTATETVTPTVTPSVTATETVTPTVTPSVTATDTVTPTVTSSVTATETVTPTVTPSVTATQTVTPTVTPTPSPTPSVTPTVTPTPLHSLRFDGAYAAAPAAVDLNLTSDRTVELWFRDEDPNGLDHDYRYLINKGDGVNAESSFYLLLGKGNLLAGLRAAGMNDPLTYELHFAGYAAKIWQHVAVTYTANTTTLVMYLNGQAVAQQTLGAHSISNTLPLEIGRQGASAG